MSSWRHVKQTMETLHGQGVTTWIGGGWASELLSLEAPRHHHDIDLFYPAGGFEALDVCLASLQEVKLKRFPHKRAFVSQNVLVEIVLMRPRSDGRHVTSYFDRYDLIWPARSLGTCSGVRALTGTALNEHWTAFEAIKAARTDWAART